MLFLVATLASEVYISLAGQTNKTKYDDRLFCVDRHDLGEVEYVGNQQNFKFYLFNCEDGNLSSK